MPEPTGLAGVVAVEGVSGVKLEVSGASPDGTIAEAEIHWFEAHGIGKRKMKVKRLL